ncbi:transmembrane protein 25 isoform X2 [Alligator mississippiensis]|uniref:transmembrane protein 25 isoform X2 n=1 Tax=Alligator mississippiensis TaxID=8496 RepID=UPI0028774657|nr:transmembrane protein 25 isoform X2 [Alligator mississippiensis]
MEAAGSGSGVGGGPGLGLGLPRARRAAPAPPCSAPPPSPAANLSWARNASAAAPPPGAGLLDARVELPLVAVVAAGGLALGAVLCLSCVVGALCRRAGRPPASALPQRLRRAESAPPAPGLRLAALRPAAPRPGAKPTAPSLTGTGAGQHAAGARGQPGPDQPGSHPVANGRAPLQGFQHEQRRDLAVSLRCDARGSGFALSWDRCCRSPGTSSQIQGGGMGGWQHRSLLQHQVSSDRGPEPLPAPRMDKSAGFSYCPSCLLGQGQFWERGQPVLPATATAWERARGAGATCACSSLGCEQVGLRCLWREPSRVDQLRRAKEKDHSSPPDCWGRRTQDSSAIRDLPHVHISPGPWHGWPSSRTKETWPLRPTRHWVVH